MRSPAQLDTPPRGQGPFLPRPALLALFALCALALSACEPEPRLELGVGEGRYNSFADGDTLDLVTGCQGSQHVWMGIRTEGLDPRGLIVDLELVRASDGEVVSQPFVVRVILDPAEDGTDQVVGLTLVVPDPEDTSTSSLMSTRVRSTWITVVPR